MLIGQEAQLFTSRVVHFTMFCHTRSPYVLPDMLISLHLYVFDVFLAFGAFDSTTTSMQVIDGDLPCNASLRQKSLQAPLLNLFVNATWTQVPVWEDPTKLAAQRELEGMVADVAEIERPLSSRRWVGELCLSHALSSSIFL